MKKAIIFQILLASFLFAQNASFNYSQMDYGAYNSYVSASQLALGNTGIAGGTALSSVFLNPALATKSSGMISLNVGMSVNLVEEDRAYPYYDTFGGFTDYGSYFFNKNWYPNLYGNLSVELPVPGLQKSVLSLGYLPFIDFAYNYLEEVGSPNSSPEYKKDKILGYNSIDNEGRLDQIPIAISFIPLNGLSVGLQLAMLNGDVNYKRNILPTKELFTDAEYEEIYFREKIENELDNLPLVSSIGLSYAVTERLMLGFNSRLPFTVDYQQKTSVDAAQDTSYNSAYSLDYPMQVGFGLEYRFSNILEARILLDFVYDFWSDFEDSRAAIDFNDTYTVSIGVEHNFFDEVPLRAGFSYATLKESKDFTKVLMTIGSGIHIRDIQMNLALGFSSLQYYQYDMFDDDIYGMLNRGNEQDRVQVNDFFGRIDFSYAFSFRK